MGKKFIVVPIFDTEFRVIVCWYDWKKEKSQLLRFLDRCYVRADPISFDGARGKLFSPDNHYPIICLPRFPRTAVEIGTLAHEATHAMHTVFSQLDETVTDHETFSKGVGAIVRETLSERGGRG